MYVRRKEGDVQVLSGDLLARVAWVEVEHVETRLLIEHLLLVRVRWRHDHAVALKEMEVGLDCVRRGRV